MIFIHHRRLFKDLKDGLYNLKKKKNNTNSSRLVAPRVLNDIQFWSK